MAVLLTGFIFTTATTQVRVRFNVNIDTQPVWRPVGYDHVDYYYLPDIDVYYDVAKRQYICTAWVVAICLNITSQVS